MSVMIEVYYRLPRDSSKEGHLTQQVVALGGRLEHAEEIELDGVCSNVCLTYEFNEWKHTEVAAEYLRQNGGHVEGPQEYGT